jgi:transcriptional regulator with XRE-family HTH domain
MTTLGQRIRNLRRQRKWTQQMLGDAMGRAQQEIYRWEKGLVRIPAEDLVLLARVFEVSIATFFPDEARPAGSDGGQGRLSDALRACAEHAAAMATAMQAAALYAEEGYTPNGQEHPHG